MHGEEYKREKRRGVERKELKDCCRGEKREEELVDEEEV